LVGELQELLACEVGPVFCDDGVGHTKPVDNVKEKLDSFLGARLNDPFCLNLLGELAHHDKQVGEASRGLRERPDHVETLDRERPGEGDSMKCLC
jgi:hypothetical protein